MDWRGASQNRKAQVEILCCPVINGIDWNRRVIYIGNKTQKIFKVQFPCLHRNIGMRIMQSQERLEVIPSAFGKNFAVVILVKTVNHDAVIAGNFTGSI